VKAKTALLSCAAAVISSPATQWVAEQLNHQPSLCPLFRVTGVTCPSCGGTRASLLLLSGDPMAAVKANAGVTMFLIVIAVLTAAGLIRPAELLGVAKPYD
jgi:Protein of unknown function (DUF2752)